jgi:hypothetical protein
MSAIIALVIALHIVATPAGAGPMLQGGIEVSTASAYLGTFTQGLDFVPTTGQSVTALGIWDFGSDGLPQSFEIGLWLTATATLPEILLASAVIDSADPIDPSVTVAGGQWRYETLGSPVALAAGTTYTLGAFISHDLTDEDSLFLQYSSLTLDPNVTVADTRRFLGGEGFNFPTNSLPAGDLFRGQVNARLAPTAIPAPASLVLLAFGVIGVAAARQRGRRA